MLTKRNIVKNTVVLDLFLGDSGKGKITDYLAQQSLGVIRFNGSNNAGHTLYVDGVKHKTHAVPSGVLYPHTVNYIGHGCVINPEVLLREIRTFEKINPAIYISGQAQVITPFHIQTDIDREKSNGIGSTKQGVSPAYEDKMARRGLRYEDLLLDRESFLVKVSQKFDTARVEEMTELYDKYSEPLRFHIVKDGLSFIHDLAARGPLLFEGAQGCFLDVDVGPYPYVTASNCTIGSVLTGTGLNLRDIHEVIGVIKAYGSYVGTNVDFDDIPEQDINEKLCELGQEYGATTGRRRRLCWLDLDKIALASRVNGPTKLVITRLDTLGQLPIVKIKYNNEFINFDPWGDISTVKNMSELPDSACRFIEFIEEKLKVPVWAIGNGPNREDLLFWDGRKDKV